MSDSHHSFPDPIVLDEVEITTPRSEKPYHGQVSTTTDTHISIDNADTKSPTGVVISFGTEQPEYLTFHQSTCKELMTYTKQGGALSTTVSGSVRLPEPDKQDSNSIYYTGEIDVVFRVSRVGRTTWTLSITVQNPHTNPDEPPRNIPTLSFNDDQTKQLFEHLTACATENTPEPLTETHTSDVLDF